MIGPDLYSFRALWRHYRQCRRNKRNTINALAFEANAEANLLALQQELRDHSYKPGRSVCFMTFLRRVTANGQRLAWALKLDVASFFPSIDKRTLFAVLARKITHSELLWLTRTLLFHDPTKDYYFRSRTGGAPGPGIPNYPIPPHKSLFGASNERGLPIGNLTSQFWGNVYLNELDQFIKRQLKCRYYLRYVDDMVLLAEDGETLAEWCEAIKRFLWEELKLSVRPEMTTPFPARRSLPVFPCVLPRFIFAGRSAGVSRLLL